MAAQLIRLGWVEAFDLGQHARTSMANIKDVYKGVDWDPNVTTARAVALRA